MPGFIPIPKGVDASIDGATRADAYWRVGERRVAVTILEATLDSCAAVNPHLPCWLVLRLAIAYRRMGRYDDEVDVLLRGRASQAQWGEESRYDARLTKAEALADRKRRTDSGALTILRIRSRPDRSLGDSPTAER